MTRRSPLYALVLALALVAASCTDDAPSATSSTSDPSSATTAASSSAEPVVREILAELVDPPGAPGRTLTLVHYTIAAGAQLPAHIHPGVQMASIESGRLTYTIESGTALVRRAGANTDEPVEGPTTIHLDAGDAVTELADMVHFGANETDEPVVIIATLLTETGEDLAVTVTDPDESN